MVGSVQIIHIHMILIYRIKTQKGDINVNVSVHIAKAMGLVKRHKS